MVTRKEAIEAISDGHTIYAPDYAREVCVALGVPFDENLVKVFESERHPLGVTMFHGPEKAVWSLTLSSYVAARMGVGEQARTFHGRGSQAREFARVVREHLDKVYAA